MEKFKKYCNCESQRQGQTELSKLRLEINVSYIFLLRLDRSLCSSLKYIQLEIKPCGLVSRIRDVEADLIY